MIWASRSSEIWVDFLGSGRRHKIMLDLGTYAGNITDHQRVNGWTTLFQSTNTALTMVFEVLESFDDSDLIDTFDRSDSSENIETFDGITTFYST